jgi:N-acyl-L-homoserine lactone synthetase
VKATPQSEEGSKAVKKSISMPGTLLEIVLQCMAAQGIKDLSEFVQRGCRRELAALGYEVTEDQVDLIRQNIARASALGIDVNEVISAAIEARENAQPVGAGV